MIRTTFLFFLAILSAVASTAAAESVFHRPAGLEPDIAFWTRIYTEVPTTSGLLHDNRRLGIVYEQLDYSANTPRSKRKKDVSAAKKRYKKILLRLASGKRIGLTKEENRVLELWPDDVTNDELKAAASRLRFQLGQADRFRAGLIRSGRWKPFINETLARRGLPPEIAALPHVESSFNPDAYSKVGAAGMWQFTRSTGRRFMRIDHVMDERMDPYIATEAAASLLAYNHDTLDSWPLALTAYNHGVSGMRRAIRKLGTDDPEIVLRQYRGRTFGFASRNFYPAFLAAAQIDADPEKYFGPLEIDNPPDIVKVSMDDYVSTAAAAESFGVDEDTLRYYNPALMPTVWTGNKYIPKGYELRLPGHSVNGDIDSLMAAIDASQRHAQQKPDVIHKVQRGDTLSGIASAYGVTVNDLMQINNLRSRNMIRAGQVLRLPAADAAVVAAAAKPVVVAAAKTPVSGDVASPGTTPKATTEPVAAAPAAPPPKPVADAADSEVVVATAMPVQEKEATVETNEFGALATAQPDLAADPSDYTVADDNRIEVQAMETLGHYADWLQIRTQRLRDLNSLTFGKPVIIGQRLKLDFSKVDRSAFEQLRIAYHRDLQEAFFARYQIRDMEVYKVQPGDSVWMLAQARYKVPVWLLRQYNPDLNFDRIRPGAEVHFPLLQPLDDGSSPAI